MFETIRELIRICREGSSIFKPSLHFVLRRCKCRDIATTLAAPVAIFIISNVPAFGFVYTGQKWGDQRIGSPALVTWSIVNAGVAVGNPDPDLDVLTVDFNNVYPNFIAEIHRALGAWSAAANIDFFQVQDSGVPLFNSIAINPPNLRFAIAPALHGNNVLATTSLPITDEVARTQSSTSILFPDNPPFNIPWGQAISGAANVYDIFTVALHELGHAAIGLNHDDRNANSVMKPEYSGPIEVLSQDDINGARYVYGYTGPVVINCDLPTSGGNMHFDLLTSNECYKLNPGVTISSEFEDDLTSGQKFIWQTLFKNLSSTDIARFVASWTFPNGGSPVINEIVLDPGQVAGISISVEDAPPEIGRWRYSASNGLPYTIGIDSSLTEYPNSIVKSKGLASGIPFDPPILPPQPNFISYYCSVPYNCIDISDGPIDIDISITPVPGPLPISSLVVGFSWCRRMRLRLTRRNK